MKILNELDESFFKEYLEFSYGVFLHNLQYVAKHNLNNSYLRKDNRIGFWKERLRKINDEILKMDKWESERMLHDSSERDKEEV